MHSLKLVICIKLHLKLLLLQCTWDERTTILCSLAGDKMFYIDVQFIPYLLEEFFEEL